MPKQPTNTDIYVALNELRKELVDRDEQLEQKIDRTYLRIQVFEAEMGGIEKEYEPIKKLVYGLVGISLAAFLTAVLGLIVKRI